VNEILQLIWTIAQDAFWSALAALGFAMLFSVPRNALVGCVVCGAAGHALRALLMHFGMGIEIGTLVGATLVGLLAMFFARQIHVPEPIFAVSGVIPMVPGAFAYRAMIGIITVASAQPDTGGVVLVEASINAIKTALILAAIAFGIAAPRLLFRRQRPIT
jgi:uncharacterized membrane protein YjjB (DUF3815 family)